MQDFFADSASAIHNALIIPILYHTGLMAWEEIAYGWVLFALYGAAQVVLMLAICAPAERLRKLEHWPDQKAVYVDIVYTLLARIGIMPLFTFVLFYQAQMMLSAALADHGVVTPTLESLVPFLYGRPGISFCLYLLLLDFADYWRHRLSHRFDWWYGLHAVHHAQRQMTFWSDDRNHVFDEIIAFLWFVAVGLLINIPPMQFPLLILSLRLLESFSHANARISFGRVGSYILVSPRFHRLHHGFAGAGRQSCNFGALFPIWDMIFGTANFAQDYVATGDPTAEEDLASGSWWRQQKGGVARMMGASGTRGAVLPAGRSQEG